MRYFYLIAILSLLVLSYTNYSKHTESRKYIQECYEINNKLEKNINVYLDSFTDLSIEKPISNLILFSKDTINLYESKNLSLVYFFPPNDCRNCIFQNIHEIISLKKRVKSLNIYIITNNKDDKYLRKMSRANKNTNVKFGFFQKPISISKSCYFIVFESGKTSNTFYPDKNNFESTQKYFKTVTKLLN